MTPERIATADAFMSWLRQKSIEHRGKIRFVVTGSIGFEPILRRAGLSATLNNFQPFILDPWSPKTAVGCLHALANGRGITFDDGAAERVTELLGSCVPHHVQVFFTHIYETCKKRGGMHCSVEDVDAVYQHRMLSTRGHVELATFEERLGTVVDEALLPFVLSLLTEAATAGPLTSDVIHRLQDEYDLEKADGRNQTRNILDILEHDGYLQHTEHGYVFISNLLRDWWARRFGSL